MNRKSKMISNLGSKIFRTFRQLAASVLVSLFFLAVANDPAAAKVFKNAYVSFELGDRWNCTLEGTEWVCRTVDPGLAEAIIILTAKEVGPSDSLSSYESYLNIPRTLMTKTGQPLQSSVYEVKQQVINNLPWINGFHFGSEVINYYTRYLATIKDRIAVLVTFSAHKLHYTKYSGEFFRAIASLNVIATKTLWANNSSPGGPGVGPFGGATGSGDFPAEPGSGELDGDTAGDMTKTFLGIALILGGAGGYLLFKRRKQQLEKKKKSEKKD